MTKILLALLLLCPSVVFGAGFAKQSLFLSRSPVTEGETVLIHAVVQNDSGGSFAGEMLFKDGGEKVGTAPVSLKAGEAQAVSVSWKPESGNHTITAQLQTKGGEVVEMQSATFVVKEKPKPAISRASSSPQNDQTAAVESSTKIQESIAGVSPQTAEAVAPLFTFIDSGRQNAADVLEGQKTVAEQNIGKHPLQGEVLGAQQGPLPNPANGFWFAVWTIYFYLLTILLFIINNAAVFYPVLAIVFLYVLWRLLRRIRRPA